MDALCFDGVMMVCFEWMRCVVFDGLLMAVLVLCLSDALCFDGVMMGVF